MCNRHIQPTKVLLIEDNPGDARLIKEYLSEIPGKAFEMDWVDRLSEGLKHIDGKDAALLDLTLPDSVGLDTFKRVHSQAAALPIIVLTGNNDETLALAALHDGAQDYLVKGQVTCQILARSIWYAIERKRIDEALKSEISMHKKLEADLVKAKEAAEEAAKAKSAFLANMSHELRTPMNAVIGFSSLLLDDFLTQEQKEYIEGIRNGGEALLAIINDILDFSSAENDKVKLELQPFSLKQLIDESLDLVAIQAGQKGLNLSQTINYGTPDTIIGDHGRLRQILVNLLTNAVKFTDKGHVSVSVSSKAVEGDQHQIFFEVKDSGIGIPQGKMNEIFEPFTQLERTLSRKRGGVGLGLAITKNLVELMGGEIWAESIPGEGTTFHFTIQAETIPGKQLDFGKMDSGIASESIPVLKPMRILVAEDNPSNQRVILEMLRKLGYRADAVANGREVIQSIQRQDYDMVLMDIKMPEMDGITATKVIRKLRPENVPKIVAITAFALEGDREKCLEAGMNDYISKPVQVKELETILKKYSVSRVHV